MDVTLHVNCLPKQDGDCLVTDHCVTFLFAHWIGWHMSCPDKHCKGYGCMLMAALVTMHHFTPVTTQLDILQQPGRGHCYADKDNGSRVLLCHRGQGG